jgi:general stress protein 26
MTTHDEDLTQLAALVKDAKIALLTTVSDEGHLHSRPLGLQQDDFDGDLWFLTQHPSSKTADIAVNPQVNVAFESDKGWVSIAGTASVVHDDPKAVVLFKLTKAALTGGQPDIGDNKSFDL